VLAGAESQFDVIVDGVTVFSKRDTGRFPAPGEVGRLLR
jgi:predicted Rdx family selenoprotein